MRPAGSNDGSWHRIPQHRNEAGAISVIFLFAGWFVRRSRESGLGLILIVASAVFLMFARAMSPIGLLPLVLLQSWLWPRLHACLLRAIVLLGPVVWHPLVSFTASIVSGPTFKGRTDMWSFAFDNVVQRPSTGFGLGAFWSTPVVVCGGQNASGWTNLASDAYNGCVSVVVELGILSLFLTMRWLICAPLTALHRSRDSSTWEIITVLFIRFKTSSIVLALSEVSIYNSGRLYLFLLIAVTLIPSPWLFQRRT